MRPVRWFVFVAAFFVAWVAHSRAATFEEAVAPVLERRCVVCHGAALQQGRVRLDTLSPDLINDTKAARTWKNVLNQLNSGRMPPEGAPQLTAPERDAVVNWLTTEVQRAIRAQRSTGGHVVMRRLNRVEYQNTMRDLLGLDIDYAKNLPPDASSPDGFQNNGAALRMSALQLEYLLQSARGALGRVIVEGAAPRVFEHHAEETVIDKVKTTNWSNRLGRTGVFAARAPEFPDEGEFVLRVKARAELPAGAPTPRMLVTLGYRADTQTPSREVARVDVASEQSREFEFHGRIEEFPLQSRTQSKYPGLLIWIRNVYSDGKPAPEGQKIEVEENGKNVKKILWTEDPGFPKIIIESVSFKAPVFENWPPQHHTRILAVGPVSPRDEESKARDVLRRFMTRAFRRPAEDDAVETMMGFYKKARPTLDSFEEALRETLAMVLISADFLYRVETATGRELDDYELASRLSYFLWSTMPDERLMELAGRGTLNRPETLSAEVRRMLEDPKSRAFVEQFSGQWLDLAGVDRIAINPNYYPDFNTDLKTDMRRETQHFFAEVLYQDLSALSFLRSDFAMLNHALAQHYGVDGPRGGAFERTALRPEDKRGGLLSQASIMLANSTGEDSHPVNRGVWIRRVLLGDPPPAPPPSVPNLDSGERGAAMLPLKRQLELHRDNAACASCHQGIDPWGVALEEFDAVGRRRTKILRRDGEQEARHPVDASATLPDGNTVNGFGDLTNYLITHKSREFARALTAKLLTYALGRSLELGDEETVDDLTTRFIESGYRLRQLITMIVTSEPFRGG